VDHSASAVPPVRCQLKLPEICNEFTTALKSMMKQGSELLSGGKIVFVGLSLLSVSSSPCLP
jgi:hypothetical protein